MAYDESLADRIRALLDDRGVDDVDERKMFGGLAFMVDGHMTVTVSGHDGIMVRTDPERAQHHLDDGIVEQVLMRGRPMRGCLRVADADLGDDAALAHWLNEALEHAATLPPK